jgi:hypothetical protein
MYFVFLIQNIAFFVMALRGFRGCVLIDSAGRAGQHRQDDQGVTALPA